MATARWYPQPQRRAFVHPACGGPPGSWASLLEPLLGVNTQSRRGRVTASQPLNSSPALFRGVGDGFWLLEPFWVGSSLHGRPQGGGQGGRLLLGPPRRGSQASALRLGKDGWLAFLRSLVGRIKVYVIISSLAFVSQSSQRVELNAQPMQSGLLKGAQLSGL